MNGQALSTAVCSVPAAPEALLSAWCARRRDLELELALDPRLPHEVQRLLLSLAREAGHRCRELAHPLLGIRGRRTPSPAGGDRYERRAAAQAMMATLELAAASEVERVVVYPSALGLGLAVEQLRRRFARCERLPRRTLGERRAQQAAGALDALRSCLDPLLNRAASYGVEIALPVPTIWPHQLPDSHEVEALRRDFAGAPLIATRFSDWAHASAELSLVRAPAAWPPSRRAAREQPTEAVTPGGLILPPSMPAAAAPTDEPPSAPEREPYPLRFADCCGLTLRLPPGCGEVKWDSLADDVSHTSSTVLTVDPFTSSEEIDRALALLAELSS